MLLALLLSGPPLLAALAVGLATGALQAATQVQGPALGVVPRLVAAIALDDVANALGAPIITGKTAVHERERLYAQFREGAVPVLVGSKVANFAIDLPSANVAIQISGTFGSRQEEAQRLGRILRPKSDGGEAHFYSLVTRDTVDQDFAQNRQLFLTEQGYSYRIVDDREVG